MTKASDNLYPKVIIQEAANDGSDFSNPAADYRVLFLGEDGLLHVKDSSGTVTSPYTSAASLTSYDLVASGDTTIVNTGTDYDAAGVSQALTAGTYHITWRVFVQVIVATSQNYEWVSKLWDGSTIYDQSYVADSTSGSKNGFGYSMVGSGVITLGGSATLKLSTRCTRASSASKITRDDGSFSLTSHKGTRMGIVKIA